VPETDRRADATAEAVAITGATSRDLLPHRDGIRALLRQGDGRGALPNGNVVAPDEPAPTANAARGRSRHPPMVSPREWKLVSRTP
jgi:hypothetical protein